MGRVLKQELSESQTHMRHTGSDDNGPGPVPISHRCIRKPEPVQIIKEERSLWRLMVLVTEKPKSCDASISIRTLCRTVPKRKRV